MIKILAISGSPVYRSSTDYILEELAASIRSNLPKGTQSTVDFVKINERLPIPCQSCGVEPPSGFCMYDDLEDVYALLEGCDCLLFGSPVYFDTVSAQAKIFIDRCNCFRPPDYENVDPDHDFLKRLTRKRPGAIVLIGGENGYFEGARRVIAGFFKWVEVVNEGKILYGTKDFTQKGTAAGDETVKEQIAELGRHLASLVKDAGEKIE